MSWVFTRQMPTLPTLTRPRPLIALVAVLMLLSPATAVARAAAPASPSIPQGFVGVNVDGPVFPDLDNHLDLGRQLGVMVSGGVQSVRAVFDWARAQPYSNWNDVPAGQASNFVDVAGVPTRFDITDQIVGLAAQRGLSVLPVVVNSPAWDADQLDGKAEANPRSVYWYGQYLQALVERYGPRGSFWAHRRTRQPIRMWQIWNEPDLARFWSEQPFAPSYVNMLQAAHTAIKQVDPSAKVVLGGLTNFSWHDLDSIYKVPGARSAFDVVAIHPYTDQPRGVIKILGYAHGVMSAHGDGRKPLIADEISWPSSRRQTNQNYFSWATTAAQQARNVAAIIPLLARNRKRIGLSAFYYYTWAGHEFRNADPWSFAGLFNYTGGGHFVAKPAFAAFKRAALALEHCRAKATATRCR